MWERHLAAKSAASGYANRGKMPLPQIPNLQFYTGFQNYVPFDVASAAVCTSMRRLGLSATDNRNVILTIGIDEIQKLRNLETVLKTKRLY